MCVNIDLYYRRKFRSQTSDNVDRWKSRGGKSQRREEERRSEKRKSQREEDAGARKGRKVATHSVFQWFVAPEGRKVGSLKRRVRSHLARWERSAARSTFGSQNVQKTSGSERFWKWRCRKSACCCGAKHISKSKCTKHTMVGPLLKFQMWFCVAGARDSAPC